MLFNDPWFLFVFLPAVLAGAVLVRRLAGARAVLGFLVLASIFFYGWWNPIYLPLLGFLTAFNYLVARAIRASRAAGSATRTHALLTFGVVTDLLALGYFKYADFFLGTANAVLGGDLPMQHIVLPLGISFFTFQKIAYLVDSSRGEADAPHDFLDYCFFVAFFPQLIAGPIVHHSEIFAQTRGRHALKIRVGNVAIGLTIFLIGLFKKVVIADNFAPAVTEVFVIAGTGHPLGTFDAWRGALSYSLQLYFDFSGYSDMAIGAARMFGIRLPLNFNSPFQAIGIIDFWRRWHMTLSRFLRDYLYIPLGGSRRGKARRYINLMLTMTIGGLWHGAAWTFVLWGFLHGVYLVVNHTWRAVWTPLDTWWSRGVSRLVTIVAVVVAFVTFRAPDLPTALRIYASMAGFGDHRLNEMTALERFSAGLALEPSADRVTHGWLWIVAWLAVVWFVPNTQQLMARFRPAYNYSIEQWRRQPPLLMGCSRALEPLLQWRPRVVGALVIGISSAIALLFLQRVSEFLYFDF
jgi:D-alanyl-lipoteichoic acid acyltransferase DltB (MBOAT superfamily)